MGTSNLPGTGPSGILIRNDENASGNVTGSGAMAAEKACSQAVMEVASGTIRTA
jgi:hypothetical protein